MADEKISQSDELAAGSIADTDVFPIVDTSASDNKKFSWSSVKTALTTYFDTLYAALSHTHTESDVTDLDHNDTTAIHDDESGEISAITQKSTPIAADHFIIEDSANSNVKKRSTLDNIADALKSFTKTLTNKTMNAGDNTFQGFITFPVTTGIYYSPPTQSLTTSTYTKDDLNAFPILIPRDVTLDAIGVEVTTGQASTNLRFGLYSVGSDGKPDSLVADFGTAASTGTGHVEVTGLAQSLTAGMYYVAVVSQGGTTQPTLRAFAGNFYGMIEQDTATSYTRSAYTDTGISGALPATFTVDNNDRGDCPYVMLKFV